MITLNPAKVAQLETLTLAKGSHINFESGACAMEAVAWLADEGHTDAPACASRVVARYIIALNDRWDEEKRQTLKPYLLRTIGTGGDGKDEARELVAAQWAAWRLLGPWLRLAGLDAEADALEAVNPSDRPALRKAIKTASDAAWSLRSARYRTIRAAAKAAVERHLAENPAAAVAAAVAVAAAAADAVAVAAAVAAAVADAVAVAAADAAADAVAVAAAAAAAAAVADAVADAVAVAAPGASYTAAYEAARKYYRENPLTVSQAITDLAAQQEGVALELLDAMIDPKPVTA